jgi:radical SAM superfamily enzyme YgiQ (UPF0313 family)
MRVLLISPAMKNYRRISEIPIALVSIATYLSQRGHTVKVVDRLVKTNSIEKIIDTFQPDFVGITLMYVKTIEDAMYCSEAAHGFGATVVWGGHLASDAPTLVLKETCVDFVIMGEGEYAWEELLNAHRDAKGYNGIKGLAYKENLRVIINPCESIAISRNYRPWTLGLSILRTIFKPITTAKGNYTSTHQKVVRVGVRFVLIHISTIPSTE